MQDLDFSHVRQFEPGTHAGLLLVRLREPGANALISRICVVVQAEGLDSFARCFMVLTDRKLRGQATVKNAEIAGKPQNSAGKLPDELQ